MFQGFKEKENNILGIYIRRLYYLKWKEYQIIIRFFNINTSLEDYGVKILRFLQIENVSQDLYLVN